jgi:hypothetical protein
MPHTIRDSIEAKLFEVRYEMRLMRNNANLDSDEWYQGLCLREMELEEMLDGMDEELQ